MPESQNLTQNYQMDVVLPDMMWEDMDQTNDPLLSALPIVHEKEDLLIWDQYENGYGLLSLRGLGGQPDIVVPPGMRKYAVAPGYYGERAILEETEMTKSREPGTPNLPADPADRISIMTQYQAEKSVNRIRQTIADFLRTGKFTNRSISGAKLHADAIENYTTIVIAATTMPKTGLITGPAWSDAANAKPLDDMQKIKLELEFGTSSRFGRDAEILCNPDVIVQLLGTAQVQQVYKDRFGASIAGPDHLNTLVQGFGLPKLTSYDRGYFPTLADGVNRSNFTRIMPTKSMIWLGTRPKNQKLGKFVLTRNMGIDAPKGVPDSPYKTGSAGKYQWADGIYVLLEYYAKMPFRYELDVGMNGGPVVHFGSAAAGVSY